MIHSYIFYPIAVIAILITGISKSGFGGGLGVLAVPLMALVIPPAQAAAIMLPVLCVIDAFSFWHYRKSWDRKNLFILLPAAMVGLVIGSQFFLYLSDAHIRILVGGIAIVFVLNFLRKPAETAATGPHLGRGFFWGTIAGIVSFGVHSGGPPVNFYLLPQRLNKSLFVGTTVVLFTIVNYTKLVPYFYLNQLNADNLLMSLILSPLAPMGVWLGVKMHHQFNERLFYNLCYTFLFFTGCKLVWDGVQGLL